MSDFDEIRPYRDSEVKAVLSRSIENDELIDLLGSLRFGKVYRWFSPILSRLLKLLLRRRASKINTVLDFQLMVEKYLAKSIRETMDGLQVKGLGGLDLSTPYLFMSNHRDIAMDPALTNYALYHNGGSTLRIAIGDNLLSKSFASDLMRLNKSFIVQRSINQPRKLLAALKKLSQYIWYSLSEDKSNIWIAHREGRAKNGWDETEPAIIKMLTIAKPKQESFANYIRSLKIVPVSISYEYDPCDVDKARELAVLSDGGSYVKAEHEDLQSIGKGISGYKGRVDLVFGEPLTAELNNPEEVAVAIDNSIVLSYELHPSNSYAYYARYGDAAWSTAKTLLANKGLSLPDFTAREKTQFGQRGSMLSTKEQEILLEMYSNPIVHKLELLQ